MAYEQKPNSGAMFRNTQKKSENHPDMRGDVYLDKTFLINMMDKSKGPLVKVALSGWSKESASGKKYLSLSASEPYEKPSVSDDDLPY
tara:strand:- start:2938 stop:3201 length:264 start_codon:yes stop_codon:yes gene_type:complete